MRATILETSFGILAFDEENKLVGKVLFSKKPQNAANTIVQAESGKLVSEIEDLINQLKKKGYDCFVFENTILAREAQGRLAVTVEVSKPSEAGEKLRSNIEQFAVETEFAKDAEDYRLWTHNITMEITKLRVKRAIEKRDLLVAQAIQTLDDLDKVINLFMGRVREWYGVHFPELDRLVEKHETYARLVLNLGNRENFSVKRLKEEEIPDAKAEGIAKVAEKSMGADLTETDLAPIQAFCRNMLSLYELRQSLETYMDKAMEEVAPNTKALIGSLLGARLIAISGGLTNLARKPASTIQVLGAEKALFRSLKTGTRPPKHGMIFQHTLLHEAKRWQRGKIARAVAGKVAIAARADAFGQRDISEALKGDLARRIEEIREKYAEPPPVPAVKPQGERPPRFEKPRHEKKWRKHRRER